MKERDIVYIEDSGMIGVIVGVLGADSELPEYVVQTDDPDESGERIFTCLASDLEAL